MKTGTGTSSATDKLQLSKNYKQCCGSGSGMEKCLIRDKHPGSATLIRIRCDSIDLPATSRPSDVSSSRAFSTLLDWKKKHSEPKDKTKQKDLSTHGLLVYLFITEERVHISTGTFLK